MVLFIWLIIRTFQLIFSVGTVFFSHNKTANNVFQPACQHNRTGPMSTDKIGYFPMGVDKIGEGEKWILMIWI
jgi:hypothetical protein